MTSSEYKRDRLACMARRSFICSRHCAILSRLIHDWPVLNCQHATALFTAIGNGLLKKNSAFFEKKTGFLNFESSLKINNIGMWTVLLFYLYILYSISFYFLQSNNNIFNHHFINSSLYAFSHSILFPLSFTLLSFILENQTYR